MYDEDPTDRLQTIGKWPGSIFYRDGTHRSAERPPEPAGVSMALVTFEPGARTAWHTHPFGQTIIITTGAGWVQRAGEARETSYAGDVVYFEPDEKHWHGATATTAMSYIAVQEKANGSPVAC